METITETKLDLPLLKKGKVRDTSVLDDKLLMVATDRLSAFDVVFKEGVPRKGEVLNQLSAFWFGKTADVIKNHFVSLSLRTNSRHISKAGAWSWRSASPFR